jgi:hypothetical protein
MAGQIYAWLVLGTRQGLEVCTWELGTFLLLGHSTHLIKSANQGYKQVPGLKKLS